MATPKVNNQKNKNSHDKEIKKGSESLPNDHEIVQEIQGQEGLAWEGKSTRKKEINLKIKELTPKEKWALEKKEKMEREKAIQESIVKECERATTEMFKMYALEKVLSAEIMDDLLKNKNEKNSDMAIQLKKDQQESQDLKNEEFQEKKIDTLALFMNGNESEFLNKIRDHEWGMEWNFLLDGDLDEKSWLHWWDSTEKFMQKLEAYLIKNQENDDDYEYALEEIQEFITRMKAYKKESLKWKQNAKLEDSPLWKIKKSSYGGDVEFVWEKKERNPGKLFEIRREIDQLVEGLEDFDWGFEIQEELEGWVRQTQTITKQWDCIFEKNSNQSIKLDDLIKALAQISGGTQEWIDQGFIKKNGRDQWNWIQEKAKEVHHSFENSQGFKTIEEIVEKASKINQNKSEHKEDGKTKVSSKGNEGDNKTINEARRDLVGTLMDWRPEGTEKKIRGVLDQWTLDDDYKMIKGLHPKVMEIIQWAVARTMMKEYGEYNQEVRNRLSWYGVRGVPCSLNAAEYKIAGKQKIQKWQKKVRMAALSLQNKIMRGETKGWSGPQFEKDVVGMIKNPLQGMYKEFENQEIKKQWMAWGEEMEESFTWREESEMFPRWWPQEIKQDINAWSRGRDVGVLTQEKWERIQKEVKKSMVECKIDEDFLTPLINPNRKAMTLNEKKKVTVWRLRTLKEQWLNALERKEAPFGIKIKKAKKTNQDEGGVVNIEEGWKRWVVEVLNQGEKTPIKNFKDLTPREKKKEEELDDDVDENGSYKLDSLTWREQEREGTLKSWLGVTPSAFEKWSKTFAEDWFKEPPAGRSEQEWTQELVDNKIREWEQWVVFSLNGEQREQWIKDYKDSERHLGKAEEGSQRVVLSKGQEEAIEKEIWLTLLKRHFNQESLEKNFNEKERMQAVNELKAHWSSKLSNAGWKKISPAFVKMVLAYSMDSKLEAKIKQWVVEHKRMALESMSSPRDREEIEGQVNDQFKDEIKDNQIKGALNGSKKEWSWSGLGGDLDLMKKKPDDWGQLSVKVDQGLEEIQMDVINDQKEIQADWIAQLLNASVEFQWDMEFTQEVLLEFNEKELEWIKKSQVDAQCLWGAQEDFEWLQEGLMKEQKAKEIKIMRWMNGFYQAHKNHKDRKERLSEQWSDLKDVQANNPFDFFDQLEEKNPYQHAKRLHEEMVERQNQKELEERDESAFDNAWTHLTSKEEDFARVRAWVKKISLLDEFDGKEMVAEMKKQAKQDIQKMKESEGEDVTREENKDVNAMEEVGNNELEIEKRGKNKNESIKGREREVEVEDWEKQVSPSLREKRKGVMKLMSTVDVTVLDSERALALEGKRMHHCVGNQSFYMQSKQGKALIFHLKNRANEAVATLMFDKHGDQWIINQNRGKYNATVRDPGLLAVTQDIQKTLNVQERWFKVKNDVLKNWEKTKGLELEVKGHEEGKALKPRQKI